MFKLHPQLSADTFYLGDFSLCALLLSRDANYPWFILVPRLPDLSELHHLPEIERTQLMAESMLLSETLVDAFNPDKLNVAALGNMVPQLHLHHIVRYTNDAAWPSPVWGTVPAIECDAEARESRINRVVNALPQTLFTAKDAGL